MASHTPLTHFTGALADSCANVTISNAADADAVRKNCRVIQGSLIFGKDLSESINLDGIEVVEGSIGHFACEPAYEACTIPKPFTISSSTLTTVNKSIDFWYFHGLEKLVLPNLTTVGQFVLLERLHNVTHLDLTQLSYIGAMVLETKSLKTLLLDGLKGFTGYGVPYVEIWNSGQVESVDGFFTNPLNVSGTRPHAAVTSLTLDSFRIPNVRTVTIGWAKLDELYLSGVNLTVILGGPSTESMEFREVSLGDGIVGIERNPKLKNLTATTFGIKYNKVLESLTVPFDQLSNFSAIGSSLRSVELPVEAERWQNLSVDISLCPALNLSSEFAADGAGKSRRTWYWPQEDMRRVSIFGEVANAFL